MAAHSMGVQGLKDTLAKADVSSLARSDPMRRPASNQSSMSDAETEPVRDGKTENKSLKSEEKRTSSHNKISSSLKSSGSQISNLHNHLVKCCAHENVEDIPISSSMIIVEDIDKTITK